MKINSLTLDEINQLFTIDEENGKLYWKIKQSCNIGDLAGSYKKGYVKISYKNISIYIRRI